MLEALFNQVAGLQFCNFIQKRFQHKCFSVNITKFLETLILNKICEWLPLNNVKPNFSSIYLKTGKYFQNLDPDQKPRPWKPGARKTWTLKSLDPEKYGINIGLKYMSDFRELCFIKTMRNVIYHLKVNVLTDI